MYVVVCVIDLIDGSVQTCSYLIEFSAFPLYMCLEIRLTSLARYCAIRLLESIVPPISFLLLARMKHVVGVDADDEHTKDLLVVLELVISVYFSVGIISI